MNGGAGKFMAAIPDEINRHVEAVVALSKRDVLLRMLREADVCFQSEQLTAAAVLAGVALKEISLMMDQDAFNRQKETFEAWRKMRDRAAHVSPGKAHLDRGAVEAIIAGVKGLPDQVDRPKGKSTSSRFAEEALKTTRGKYAFVGTSVDEFLRRKREDLDLEEHK